MLTGPARHDLIERMVQRALPTAPSRAADLATAALCTDLVGWDGTQAQSQWTKLAAAAGLELWHPFLDRRLVETLLSFPPIQRMAYDRAIAKPVLRRAMAARLPAIIAARTDFTEFSAFVAQAIFDPTPERVRALLSDGLLISSGIVRRDAIGALLSLPSCRADLRAVTELVAAELWLRRL